MPVLPRFRTRCRIHFPSRTGRPLDVIHPSRFPSRLQAAFSPDKLRCGAHAGHASAILLCPGNASHNSPTPPEVSAYQTPGHLRVNLTENIILHYASKFIA